MRRRELFYDDDEMVGTGNSKPPTPDAMKYCCFVSENELACQSSYFVTQMKGRGENEILMRKDPVFKVNELFCMFLNFEELIFISVLCSILTSS